MNVFTRNFRDFPIFYLFTHYIKGHQVIFLGKQYYIYIKITILKFSLQYNTIIHNVLTSFNIPLVVITHQVFRLTLE